MTVPVPLESVRQNGGVPPAAQRQDPTATAGSADEPTNEGLKALREKWKKYPSDEVDPDKAKQILKDGAANGEPLTDKQRGMFGAAAGRGEKGIGQKGEGLAGNGRERAGLETSCERKAAPKGKTDMSDSGGISGAGKKGLEDAKPSEVAAGGVDGGSDGNEPVSSQVMRRWHEDNSILMEDYDRLNHHLEHAPTKKPFEKKIAGLGKELDWLEQHHKTHHPDLPALGKDEEDAGGAAEADSEPKLQQERETEGSDVENVEGLSTKGLRNYYLKGIREHYKAKALLDAKIKALPAGRDPKGVPGGEEFQPKPGATGVDPDGDTDLGEEEHQPPPGQVEDGSDPAAGTDLGAEEGQQPPGGEADTLAPHHKAAVANAYKFMKELESADEFTREHQMGAYHHAKNMEEVAGEVGDESAEAGGEVPPVEETHEANALGKSFPEAGRADAEAGVTEGGSSGALHGRVRGAANLLHEIAHADDLTEVHRAKLKQHGDLLAPLSEQLGEANVHKGKSLGALVQGQLGEVKRMQNVMTNLLSRFN